MNICPAGLRCDYDCKILVRQLSIFEYVENETRIFLHLGMSVCDSPYDGLQGASYVYVQSDSSLGAAWFTYIQRVTFSTCNVIHNLILLLLNLVFGVDQSTSDGIVGLHVYYYANLPESPHDSIWHVTYINMTDTALGWWLDGIVGHWGACAFNAVFH